MIWVGVSLLRKLIPQEKQGTYVCLCTQQLNFLARWKHLAYLSCKWNKQKTNGPFEKCETQTHPLPLESPLLKSSVMYTDAQLALLDSHVFKHLRYSRKIPLSATFLDLNPRSEEIPPHPSSLWQPLNHCLASVSWSTPSSVSSWHFKVKLMNKIEY